MSRDRCTQCPFKGIVEKYQGKIKHNLISLFSADFFHYHHVLSFYHSGWCAMHTVQIITLLVEIRFVTGKKFWQSQHTFPCQSWIHTLESCQRKENMENMQGMQDSVRIFSNCLKLTNNFSTYFSSVQQIVTVSWINFLNSQSILGSGHFHQIQF